MSSPSSTSSAGTKLPFIKKFGSRTQFSKSSRLALGDDDDDQEETEEIAMVAGFEGNRIQELNKKEEAKPLVIAPIQSAEDWRTKRRKIYVPSGGIQQQQMSEAEQKPEVLDQQTQSFGLQVMTKRTTTDEATVETTAIDIDATQVTNTVVEHEEQRPKTLEELAADALLKEAARTESDDEESTRSNLVISAVDETQAFREDMMSRPNEATMDDYDRVPVDQFGAALLRGLGWKEGEGIGRNRKNMPLPKPFEPAKQREALLGLGAKTEDLRNGKRKDRRAAYTYKETSLFKKVAKRRLEELNSDSDNESRTNRSSSSPKTNSRRSLSPSESHGSSRHSSRHSSRNRSRSRERSSRHNSTHNSRDKDSSRERSRRRRSRSRDSNRSSRRN